MKWHDLDPNVRRAVRQLTDRGFRSAAVRLIVSQTGCPVSDAQAVIALAVDESGRIPDRP